MIGQRRYFYLRLALFFSIASLLIPSVSHADSWLEWTSYFEDPETGEFVIDEQITIEDGGTYQVPLNEVREVQVESDEVFFGAEGMLFHIPDPDEGTREFIAHLGGFFGDGELAWTEAGIYELDVYWLDPPEVNQTWPQRLFAFFFGTLAHAQAADHLLETIRFTITEDGAFEECCSSVVFLPGIKGSVLKSGSDTLWPPTIWSDDVQQLALEDGESVNEIVVDGILENFSVGPFSTPIYSPFGDFLNDLVSEGLINDWLPLAYDWRFSPEKILEDGVKTPDGITNILNGVEELAAQSQTGQVTLVAHSMGGLMGKVIIKKLEEEDKDDLIDSFVMVGSPQLGTPQAVASILHGDGEGIPSGFAFVVHPEDVRAVAQNMPGAYNLLPSERYFEDVLDPPIIFDAGAAFTEPWIDFWGDSINDFGNFFSFLTGMGVARSKPPENLLRVPEVLDPELLSDAIDFHSEYDTYQFPEHIRVVQVAGWGRPTTKAIEYTENHSLPSYRTIPTIEGDGTVVYPSALSSAIGGTYFFDVDQYRKDVDNSTQHRDLLSKPPIQDLTFAIISEEDITESTYISETKPEVTEVADTLIVSSYSPVLLGAYDEFDNFTGIDPNQDLSADILFITENIPGSSFLYTSESQHIFLPKTGVYHFVYTGIGDGLTTVTIENFSGDLITPLASYSDIPTTASTTAAFDVSSISPEETLLELDVDGDTETDMLVWGDGTDAPLEEVFTLIKEKINDFNLTDRYRRYLLQRIEHLEEKVEKMNSRNIRGVFEAIEALMLKIRIDSGHEKIAEVDAQTLLDLLAQLQSAI